MDKTILSTYLKRLEERMQQTVMPVTGWKYRTADYLDAGRYDNLSDWQNVTGSELFPAGKTIFLKTACLIPNDLLLEGDRQDYLFCKIAHVEGYLRVNGQVYHGLDANRERIPLNPAWKGQEIALEIEVFNRETRLKPAEQPWFMYSEIRRIDRRIESFYYDLKLAVETHKLDQVLISKFAGDLDAAQRVINAAPHGYVRPRIMQAINLALRDLDLALEGDAFIAVLIRAQDILQRELQAIDDGSIKGLVSLIGHTHIDVAWLWQLKDTVRKCGHSFANMLRIMEEFPEFTFSCSQPQLYAYTARHYPELYEQIKKQIISGRWELVGPMWVESDCNVISGESLVRQLLHGHRFMLEQFGQTSDICWLPDTFGFQPNMPQILKKSGVNKFFSYKLHWQATTRFPYGSFRWRGIDGSEIVASVPELFSGYNGNPVPAQIQYAQNANLQKDSVDDVIFTYGFGDGGGGPTRDMVEFARRLHQYPSLPDCRMTTAKQYFDDLSARAESLPVWYGELSLETHRGTFTSHGFEKKANRNCEILLQTAEKLAVISGMTCAQTRALLKQAWETVLLLQFHDILPGSSVNQVYSDAEPMYRDVAAHGESVISEVLQQLAGPTDPDHHDQVVVFNPLGWARSDVVNFQADCSNDEEIQLLDNSGAAVPVVLQRLGSEHVQISFSADNIPSLGLRTYQLKKAAATGLAGKKAAAAVNTTASGIHVESSRYSLVINNDGQLTRLYDKNAGRDVLAAPANDLQLFHDGPQGEDAWNLYEEYRQRPYLPDWQSTLELEKNDFLQTVLKLTRRSAKTLIAQKIIINHCSGRIDFMTDIDWQERHKLLKVGFPLAIQTAYAVCDTGFGSYQRPVVANTPYDQQRFEVVAHKWVDLSEGDYGAAVLNDCKYGHSIVDNRIEISLLRSTAAPDETADMGKHTICYALFPHAGDWRQGQTARQGFVFNTPLLCSTGSARSSDVQQLSDGYSLMSIDHTDLIIDTVKPAWNGQGVIIRIHETAGNRGQAVLKTARRLKAVHETNLIENDQTETISSSNQFQFSFKPYEILTFRLIWND